MLRKIVAGLYWLKYKRLVHMDDLGPIGFWPYNVEGRVPTEAFLAAYSERFEPKRWTVVRRCVFEYMFANQIDRRLGCIIKWHDTLWVTCIVPRPSRGHSKKRVSGQEELP